jgi:aspartate/tyrosine/aromatic aminotransferase
MLMQAIARPMYSNPPLHGALLVSQILKDAELKQQWYKVSCNSLPNSMPHADCSNMMLFNLVCN